MRFSPQYRMALSALASVASLLAAVPSFAQTPEFRAMWASRYEWPDANEAACKANIDAIMQDLADANFNAVLFQIRGQADTLYPSPEEVWSILIGGTDPGWDPLAYAVQAAHSRGIAFHAYINTHPCWASGTQSPPPNPNHLFYAHCNAADPAHRDWLHHNVPDNPVQFSESDYVWMAPGVPDFQAYIRRQILYVVENYDVDGVHFDRIRTPWSNQPSYDPISLARYNSPWGNPNGLDFTQWTADQITRNVRDIYAAIMAVRPEVVVSAAVYSNPLTAPTAQHQEALVWANTGGMDMLVPMMYFTGGAGSTWDTRLQLWLSGAPDRQVVAGHSTSQGTTSLLQQVELTRLRGGHGNSIFSWSSFTGWSQYVAEVYQTPVGLPVLTWKTSPATAIIYGYVTGTGGQPLADATLVRSGSDYVALSTGDGFYSFLLVPPGTYSLDVSHSGYAPATATNITVAAGDVVRHDISLTTLLAPVIAEIEPDPDSAIVGVEYTRQLILAQGDAESWTLLDGPSGADVDATGRVYGWTPTVGDLGQVFTFSVQADNLAGSDTEDWFVQVVGAPPCTRWLATDFEGYDPGTRVMFNLPRYSGSTSADLATSPNVAEVSADAPAFSGSQSLKVQWQWIDTDPQRWMRLTTSNAPYVPNPTITLDRPVRVRLRAEAGRFRLAIGIRETGTSAEIGEDGGTSGTIEWVGAASDDNGAPQGVLVEPMPGVWQTFVFNPLTDPIHGMTGDGTLYTPTNKGVLEHVAFSIVDSAGPITVYIDDVELLCGVPPFGDMDGDFDVDLDDYPLWEDCFMGPDVLIDGSCQMASGDGDADVDLIDFRLFSALLAP